MPKRKICVITAARSEYSASKWLMDELLGDPEVTLQVVVTGAHLESHFGETISEIEHDGIPIDAKVPMGFGSGDPRDIAKAMSRCGIGMADALSDLCPDILVVFGDRYELLPICGVATMLNVPIAHVSGGDITEGAVDDSIRHAITKLSHIHFPGTSSSANVLKQLGEDPERIFIVGEPGLDNFTRLQCLTRETLASDLGMDLESKWILMTYHPETRSQLNETHILENMFQVLDKMSMVQIMMTYPNGDPGSDQIIDCIQKKHESDPRKYRLEKSLGQLRFVSFLKQAWCMLGNSSSSLFEAPSASLPAILIGERQKGRLIPTNIIEADGSLESVARAFDLAGDSNFQKGLEGMINPYGNGDTAIQIARILKQIDLSSLLRKPFIRYAY